MLRRARPSASRPPPAALALASALALLASCARAPAAPAGPEAAIRSSDLAADVAWLADPARGGRGTGSPGGAEAQAWVADRMRALGLAPAGDAGTYLQAFEAPVGARLAGENALRVGGRDLALERDFLPFTFSEKGEARGELVWVGHGITAPDVGHDDYAGLDVRGKVVVVGAHFPREEDPASPFRDPSRYAFGEWRYKAMNARDHGAAGLVGVRDDWNHPGGDALEPFHGAASSRAGIVAARATLVALAAGGVDAAALAAPGQRDGKPHSRALGVEARLAASVEQERARTANVVGALPGSDPAAGCVVVGAHLDHLGMGGEASLAPGVHAVHPGADDNASGVAALLGVARAMAAEGRPPRRTVVFAAFAAEELGLLGSAHLVKNPPAGCPPEATQLMVNLDMVGRAREGKVYVQGADTAQGGRARVEALAAAAPALPLRLAFGGDGYGPSDQTSFYARGVPVLFLFTGAHGDYHRPTDTADKVDPGSLAAVARLAYRAARAAADAPERYVAVKVPPPPGAAPGEPGERARGYGAYLGSGPDFEERKEPGVLVSAVRAGSPAERAGMKAGDVLVQVGATRIVALPDLAYALRSHRPGDVVDVVWRRGGQETRAQVTLAERR
ncbi:MAG TPA: M20/M25/M40 family metallo-hydrolase [Anaeromyxobacteraceae bacterium]|nr:M20/M25/M40 family metallo-hydrolase [Anaeromyxobacteraceae bacterium]